MNANAVDFLKQLFGEKTVLPDSAENQNLTCSEKGPRFTWTIYKCRSSKYLLKIPYFIKDYPSEVGCLIFETDCLDRSKTLPYVGK